MTDQLYVDNSLLKTLACSTKTLMRHLHGYTSVEESAILKSGSDGHAALAEYLRTGSKAQALAVLKAAYKEWAEANVPPDDRLGWFNVHRVVSQWLDNHPVASLPFLVKPDLVEIGFTFPLTDDESIMFYGRLDAIGIDKADGAWYVPDHKFTGRIDARWLRSWKVDSGLSGYIWAAQQHTHEKVVGAIVNAIELSKLPSDPQRKCRDHAVPYSECGGLHLKSQIVMTQRTPEQLAEWKKTAISLARRYQKLIQQFPEITDIHRVRQQGMFHGMCTFCECFDWCSIGRPLNTVESFFVYSPWKPFEQAREQGVET